MESPAITVSGLSRRFEDFYAVNRITFEVEPGEIFGLLGPNGAGKTTTIRILSTIVAPDEGTARVNGYDITRDPRKVRESIGVLTTQVGLYERFTARENIEYFGRLYGMEDEAISARIDMLVELLDAADFQHRRADTLSTGMRQKVAIARSVVHDPPVIIFDEPTLGLDVLASQTVRGFMHDAGKAGSAVLLSTHDMLTAQKMCNRVAVIHQGRLIAQGSPADIISHTRTTNLEDAFVELVSSNPGGEG